MDCYTGAGCPCRCNAVFLVLSFARAIAHTLTLGLSFSVSVSIVKLQQSKFNYNNMLRFVCVGMVANKSAIFLFFTQFPFSLERQYEQQQLTYRLFVFVRFSFIVLFYVSIAEFLLDINCWCHHAMMNQSKCVFYFFPSLSRSLSSFTYRCLFRFDSVRAKIFTLRCYYCCCC